MTSLTRALLTRYLRRHWARALGPGGRLDDLFVTLDEVRDTLDAPRPPPSALPDAETVAARIAAARATPLPPPARALRDRTGLAAEALELLRVALALQDDPGLLRASTFAWADFAVKQPTAGFLVELVADDDAHAARLRAALDPSAPLRRLRLVALGDGGWRPTTPLLHRPLTVPDAVARAMAGAPVRGEGLPEGAARLERHGPRPAELVLDDAERLGRALSRCVSRRDPTPLALVGERGTGRRTLARAWALDAGRPLMVVDLALFAPDPEAFARQLTAALRDGLLEGAVTLLRLPAFRDGDRRPALLAQALAAVPTPTVLTASPAALAPVHRALDALRVIDLGEASLETRGRLFAHLMAQNAFTVDADTLARLVDAYRLGPGDLDRVLGDVRVDVRDSPTLDPAAFDRAVRRQVRTQLGDLAERVTTTQRWADLVIGEEQRAAVHELIAHARHGARVFDAWGLGAKVGQRGRGLSCLFSGPPGTGKTMTAALIARELGLDLFQVDLSRVVDKYVGETEKNLARLFAEAAKLPVVLLFDEADSLFATRTKVESSNDRFANLEINYLLQLMERHEGICILTTNMGTGIDQAFMRRLRFRVHFNLPGPTDRLKLWRAIVPEGFALADDVDLEWLARRWELSGALIRNAFVRAAFLAAEADAPVDQEMLIRATRAELAEMGRLGAR